MTKVVCTTNLDVMGEKWPRELPEIPRVGDEIESATLRHGRRLSLKVVAVRWKCAPHQIAERWYPEIELHMKSIHKNVIEFHKWYESFVRGNQ